MARIYSTSYFHYTKSLANLESILQNGFQGYYCKEDFKYKGNLLSVYVPMVSFCDLPLSHIASMTYGDYAIGMTSIWGNANKVTPVCYFPKLSANPLTRYISRLAYDFVTKKVPTYNASILAYSKPKNKYVSRNHTWDNYKERECRRVQSALFTINEGMHKQACHSLKLLFHLQDISFIIVKDEQDKDLLIKKMAKWKRLGGSPIANLDLLYSKILTKREIANNF